MHNIKSTILKFYLQLETDNHHRYKSWEHCYQYFMQDDIDIDTACLHLAFYLASWGMYRGSSFLLWKDYLIHRKVVKHLMKNRHLQGIDFSGSDRNYIDEIFASIDWIKAWYKNNIKQINGKDKKINVTDTLATKILLGTLGCIPAYDRYFIDGIRSVGLKFSELKKCNFLPVVDFYLDHKNQFDYVHHKILKSSGVYYPPMKLLDMYFWELGFRADEKF